MKILELRKKTKEELENLLLKNREELRKLRFNIYSKKVKNVKTVKNLKRDVAKILTILKDKKEENA